MQFDRCYGCMRELPAPGAVCPHCGFDNTNGPKAQNAQALPCGTVLQGKFIIGKTLGQGGFGVTYIGWNRDLETAVCIKEYFPAGSAMRDATHSTQVTWSGGADPADLRQGQENFLKEARKAVKLRDLHSVVTVWDVFQENDTAYIIMDYIEGESLKKHLIRTQRPLGEAESVALLAPVMADLGEAHRLGIIHRDISPDNIMMRTDGNLMLLDLGAAKDLTRGNGQSSQVVAKRGFSPLEQYTPDSEIGPWTDVYAMCATIVYCTTGKLLPEAVSRVMGKKMDLSGLTPGFQKVLEKGLAIHGEDRYQTMGELLKALKAAETQTPHNGGKQPDTREKDYRNAKALLDSGDENSLRAAQNSFRALGSYRDAAALAEECAKRLEKPVKRAGNDLGGGNGGGKKPMPKFVVPLVAGALLLGAGGYYIGTHQDKAVKPEPTPYSAVTESATPTPTPSPTPTPTPTPTPIPTPSGEPLSKGKTEDGLLSYEVFADCVRISACYKFATEVRIPSTIEGKPVTSITDDAFFARKSLKEIIVDSDNPFFCTENGVLYSKDKKLLIAACPAASPADHFTVPDGVEKVYKYAFNCNQMKTLRLPASVKAIEAYAFYETTGLTSILVDDGNPFFCSVEGVLYSKDMKKLVAFPPAHSGTFPGGFEIPDGVETLGDCAFSQSSMETIKIPNSVKVIGREAFSSSHSLAEITIPEGVTKIGDYAFASCSSLKNITFPVSVKTISYGTFDSCGSLENFVIPDGVTEIGPRAFVYCSSLKNITIPSSVKTIGEYAFDYCVSLEKVVIHDGVTEIEPFVFGDCPSLTDVTIPASVVSISQAAFSSFQDLIPFSAKIHTPAGSYAASFFPSDQVVLE